MPPDPTVRLALAMIDQAFDRRSWHGTNLRGAIRGLNADAASWRPAPGRHNIWELTVHAAYWKYAVRRRLLQEKRGTFPLEGSDWFARPLPQQGDERAWRRDVALLVESHQTMRQAVAALRDFDLELVPAGSKVSNGDLVTGIAAHDLYHAGQIQLIKRLMPRRRRAGRG